jgi:Fe-S oxidoreductase
MGFNFDVDSPVFWDEGEIKQELTRVFDICHSCRRCYNLCPSFNVLLDGIDEVSGEAADLPAKTVRDVVDLCFQCKLCDPHCPYVPPHRWEVDFPRLMLRAKAARVKKEGMPLQDKALADPDALGSVASRFPNLANWANERKILRVLMEKTVGIHRERNLPRYSSMTFNEWFARHRPEPQGENGKVLLFYTCTVNYNDADVGAAAVQVLARNKVGVVAPPQVCCGMPAIDGGDITGARQRAQENLRTLYGAVQQGYKVVVPGPTCGYMIRREYPHLIKDEASKAVADNTFDLCEYLMNLHREKRLDRNFTRGLGKVAYQVPCHLRVMNIGFKSRDLLRLLPDTTVELIEKCAGVDGTWGFKKEYFHASLKVARGMLREIDRAEPDVTVSDCPLAGLQVQHERGYSPRHPIQLVRDAYGMEPLQV